jgi:hypothetical protein
VYIDHFSQVYELENSNVSLEAETKPVEAVQNNNGKILVESLKADLEHLKVGNDECEHWEFLYDTVDRYRRQPLPAGA